MIRISPPLVVLFLVLASGCSPPSDTRTGLDLQSVLGGNAQTGFARADTPRVFSFPEDHAEHPDYRNEWWYLTGNLTSTEDAQYGYQLTFFRAGLNAAPPSATSTWTSNTLWMAHFAVTDIAASQHWHDSRLSRGGKLAGQGQNPFSVWLDDWRIVGQSADGSADFPWHIQAATSEFSLDLTLTPQKPMALNGLDGLSFKGGDIGNASYYYSATRLASQGHIELEGKTHSVRGLSWLDREWSTSALAEDTVGWDWFSLQLGSGWDVMLYQLRTRDGTAHSASAGSAVSPEGAVTRLVQADFSLTPLRQWQAPDGRSYPVTWRVQVPRLSLDATVDARLDAQWMNTAVIYWEGAVAVRDSTDAPLGLGYLEMTGY